MDVTEQNAPPPLHRWRPTLFLSLLSVFVWLTPIIGAQDIGFSQLPAWGIEEALRFGNPKGTSLRQLLATGTLGNFLVYGYAFTLLFAPILVLLQTRLRQQSQRRFMGFILFGVCGISIIWLFATTLFSLLVAIPRWGTGAVFLSFFLWILVAVWIGRSRD